MGNHIRMAKILLVVLCILTGCVILSMAISIPERILRDPVSLIIHLDAQETQVRAHLLKIRKENTKFFTMVLKIFYSTAIKQVTDSLKNKMNTGDGNTVNSNEMQRALLMYKKGEMFLSIIRLKYYMQHIIYMKRKVLEAVNNASIQFSDFVDLGSEERIAKGRVPFKLSNEVTAGILNLYREIEEIRQNQDYEYTENISTLFKTELVPMIEQMRSVTSLAIHVSELTSREELPTLIQKLRLEREKFDKVFTYRTHIISEQLDIISNLVIKQMITVISEDLILCNSVEGISESLCKKSE